MTLTKRLLRVFFISNSGAHAIINWILQQSEGPAYFIRDITDFSNIQTGSVPGEPRGKALFFDKSKFAQLPKKFVLESYKDIHLGRIWADAEAKNLSAIGGSDDIKNLLILRDPFNLFSSLEKSGKKDDLFCKYKGLWKIYAREYLGETNYLQNRLNISFNHWHTDPSYRESLCRLMEIPFTDSGFNSMEISKSPFDQKSYDGKASKMPVLQRWLDKHASNRFRTVFLDKELWDLTDRIFKLGSNALPKVPTRDQIKPSWDG